MTVKLIALAVLLATLIPHRATAAGLTVHVQVLVLIILLAAAAGGLIFALRQPWPRPYQFRMKAAA